MKSTKTTKTTATPAHRKLKLESETLQRLTLDDLEPVNGGVVKPLTRSERSWCACNG